MLVQRFLSPWQSSVPGHWHVNPWGCMSYKEGKKIRKKKQKCEGCCLCGILLNDLQNTDVDIRPMSGRTWHHIELTIDTLHIPLS